MTYNSFMDTLGVLAAKRNIAHMGICRFADVLPLIQCRAASRLPAKSEAVLVFLFPYYTGDYPERNISRYAMVNDYHRVVGDILHDISSGLTQVFPGRAFVPFVDSSPIREVEAARLAGLGDIGRNGQLINKSLGSYAFIGTVVTDLTIEGIPGNQAGGVCEGCGACVRACPTGALYGAAFNRELCRSHITQKKAELTPWEREQVRLGGMAWGCDICLEACPHNLNAPITPIPGFLEGIESRLTLENLERLHPDKPYNYRKKDVLERNLRIVE
jgi:ferredoxin